LLKTIEVGPPVFPVFIERFLRPLRKSVETVIVGIVITEIIRELSANDQFFEKWGFDMAGDIAFFNLKGHPLGRELAEMQIR
jgi:hypothetical protein